MSFKRVFWPVFRVIYFVSAIVDVAVLCLWLFPPKDGDFVHALIGALLINTLTLIIGWAFIPWPRPELTVPQKKLTPTPKKPEGELEDIHGRQGLEDYLERRRTQKK